MKKILPLLTLFILINSVYSQIIPDSLDPKEKALNTITEEININIPDTLQIENVSKKLDNLSFLEENMPWIVALIIGFLSVLVNFWVARKLRQSNEQNLKNQLESNERNLQRQIELAKETKLLEFKATIATKNRQEWINELRHTLSEYLSSVSLTLKTPKNPTQKFLDKKSELIQRMSLSKSKLELLMNVDKAEQKELLDEIENLLSTILLDANVPLEDKITGRSNVIIAARKLFAIHWTKIKELK